MQSAVERRQLVLEAISDRRTVQIESLAAEFGVSRRTIERDITEQVKLIAGKVSVAETETAAE